MLPVSLCCPIDFLWSLYIDDVNQSVYPFLNVKIVITGLLCLLKINTTVLLCVYFYFLFVLVHNKIIVVNWRAIILRYCVVFLLCFIFPRYVSCAQCCRCILIVPSIFSNVYLSCVLCTQCWQCLSIFHSWMPIRFSLTFIWNHFSSADTQLEQYTIQYIHIVITIWW